MEIFFPFMFLVTFSVIYFNLHFPVMGEGGGRRIGIFFLLLGGWGDYCFFSITVSGELQNIFGI